MDISKQFSLEGKVALVTGAAYGIGFAIAEGLAAAGAKIAFNCRGEKHMEEALEAYKAKGIEAHGYFADVTKEEDIKNLCVKIDANARLAKVTAALKDLEKFYSGDRKEENAFNALLDSIGNI